ncbi:MAG: hypothetical protein Q7T50_05190 [Candidatus Magasanikbacteria bacterium]|nr:hypothetical protein [Candidatus Magasanikbacteria bacterium]
MAKNKKPQIFSYGGSFNPVCIHHRQIAEFLVKEYGLISLRLCWLRPDKDSVNEIAPQHRMAIARMVFGGMSGVFLDEGDFVAEEYFPTIRLEEQYQADNPGAEIWHVFGTDLFKKNVYGVAEIETWDDGPDLFANSNFVLIERPGFKLTEDEYPPHHQLIKIPGICGSGTDVREMIRRGESTEKYLDEKVRKYIDDNNLYRK